MTQVSEKAMKAEAEIPACAAVLPGRLNHKCALPKHESTVRHRCGEVVSGTHIETQRCGYRWSDVLEATR